MRANASLPVALAALVVLAGCSGVGLPGDGTTTQEPPRTTDVEENVSAAFVVDGERVPVTLEVANAPEERSRGLMHRQSLPRNHGMVFVYGQAAPRTFWMKNTLVPLDIVFVAANGTVVNVAHADPQPNATDAELRRYSSDAPAKYVVEMQQGFANRTGVGPGTELAFNESRPTTES